MPTTTPPLAAPSLSGELLEEIFLRFLPNEPSFLVRASLASKLSFGLLTSPNFQSRYREFHGALPMLGFFCNQIDTSDSEEEEEEPVSHFVPATTSDSCISKDGWIESKYDVWDCRHGHVLFGEKGRRSTKFIIRNPMTSRWTEVHIPKRYMVADNRVAAMLCAMTGCDHRQCHEGPFRLVFAYLYVGEGEDEDDCVAYAGILKYNLSSNCLSLLDGPLVEDVFVGATILTAMEDDSLGLAHMDRLTLYLWSRQMGSDGVASWTQRTVINLKNLLPVRNPERIPRLIGSVEGCDTLFVTIDLGIYEINLKSLRWKTIWKTESLRALFPYMSFYNPKEREDTK
uniref:F-box domain-containing protein n=1 Tax=Aegilops tauschii TaxID=37682 RepID=M8BRT7_AEGTA